MLTKLAKTSSNEDLLGIKSKIGQPEKEVECIRITITFDNAY